MQSCMVAPPVADDCGSHMQSHDWSCNWSCHRTIGYDIRLWRPERERLIVYDRSQYARLIVRSVVGCHVWSYDRSQDATIDRMRSVVGCHDWSYATIGRRMQRLIVRSVVGRNNWSNDRSIADRSHIGPIATYHMIHKSYDTEWLRCDWAKVRPIGNVCYDLQQRLYTVNHCTKRPIVRSIVTSCDDRLHDQSCDYRSPIIHNWCCHHARLLVRSRKTYLRSLTSWNRRLEVLNMTIDLVTTDFALAIAHDRCDQSYVLSTTCPRFQHFPAVTWS